ncbi:uncharacterized protein LOC131604974 [Vicia villosa]|uniref:uncharacterized protein LOC131604974 n=1 Tax=Vicia villosa TaxID=3911 RepID=UPI00273B0706|nr:uncharacterized protein LOC131604974 [Vicia villosa]
MSQPSEPSSPQKTSPISAPESIPRNEPVKPNQVLVVSPLKMVTTEDLDVKKAHTPHARRAKENVRGKGTNPSSSTPHEELTKKGSEYVHNAIAKIVTRILDEQHQVPGIIVPLQYVISKTPQNPELNEDTIGKTADDDGVHTTGGDAHMADDDVHIPNDDVQMTEEEEDDVGVQKNNDNADVTLDVTNNTEDGPDADECINVVNLDDLSDSDLVANANPSIAKRLMTRRGKKVVDQSPPKREVVLKSTSGPIKRKVPKSTSTGPIRSKYVSQCTRNGPFKSKVVPKSTSVDPTKSWSKVVPKKMKAQVIAESDSDVAMDYQDTPLKKKPTTSKLVASVPEVPIDNVSFHYPSSANRWKYVYQKRMALERELAQNALECKEIMDLINEVGLINIVTHFSKCYEMLVKEFIVNLSEDCADRKSKDFRKVCHILLNCYKQLSRKI